MMNIDMWVWLKKIVGMRKTEKGVGYRILNCIRFRFIVTSLTILLLSSCSHWRNAAKRNMTVVFYNVENLFNAKDDRGSHDDEFTPQSQKKWNDVKYRKKLTDISRAISAVNEGDLPEIVGLCEV